MMLQGLYALLAGSAPVAALVAGRIYPVRLPDADVTFPALTYMVVGGSSEPTFDTAGMQSARMQFDCYGSPEAAGYTDAALLRDALRHAIDGYRGVFMDGSFVEAIEWLQDVDFFDQESRNYRCMSEYYVHYNFNS